MTEDEAKTKWCPMAASRSIRFTTEEGRRASTYRTNERGEKIPSLYCIGSDCMMWRKGPKYDENDMLIEPRVGWCGLGGKP